MYYINLTDYKYTYFNIKTKTGKIMLNKENEVILKQEHGKFNKPTSLIKITQNRELTARD